MQWFISSFIAQYEIAMGNAYNEPVQFSVGQMFYIDGYLSQETDFNILITAIGDENGSTQKFIHKKFSTTSKLLDPPVVVVTPVESGQHEYESKFNIKAPNKDVLKAYYGANYVRDWVVELNADNTTYATLCQNSFTADEIEQINSDEGLVVSFPSLDGETTRLAVLAYNEEYTTNVLKEGCEAIADCSTKLLPLGVHYDSPLFEKLQGDWTMTAKAFVRDYDDNSNLVEYTTTFKTKVTISSEVNVPEMTDEVYALYEKFDWSKEETDGYYEDFKATADQFNKYVTSGNYPMINVDFVEPRGYYTSDTPADIRNWMEEVHSTQDAMAGIAVNSAYKDGQIVIKTSVKAAVEGQYRIGALLVEDGIEGQQNGAKPSETDMHIHNHCVRFADCASNHSGHKLGTIKAGDTVEYFFSWDLNDASMQWNKKPHGGSLWKAPVMENTYLVICVYVTDSTGKSIIVNNAVTAAIGASVQFEYK